MIKMDPMILEFVSNNLLAIGLFLGLLKGVAKITPWSGDDKIITLFENLFKAIRPNGKTNDNS